MIAEIAAENRDRSIKLEFGFVIISWLKSVKIG